MLYTLIEDDQVASYRRAQIQGLIDGNPPFSEQKLRELGQGERVNVNWGHAGAKVEACSIPYFDMLTSVPQFAQVRTKYGGNLSKREDWSGIITEEFQRLLIGNKTSFLSNHQLCQKNLIVHGQACMYFPDGVDWRARAIDPWQVIVPRGASCDWESWEFCFLLDQVYTTDIYRRIADPEVAEAKGWSIKWAEEAMINARIDEQDQRRPWEWYQNELRDNGLYYSYSKSKIIKLAHMFVREYPGRISHYIFDRLNPGEWMCKVRDRYKSFSEAFTIFLNGVGAGDYHSVRGLGQQLYGYGQAMNRLNNGIIEGTLLQSAPMFQPQTAKDAEQVKTIQIGPYKVLPPGMAIINTNMGTALQGAMNVLEFFQGQENENIGSFVPSVSGGTRKKSNKQLELEMDEKAKLTNSRAELYMSALDTHYKEVYRRAANPNLLEEDGGGREALEFQQRCFDRGVPQAALLDISSVTATRSIGQGSAAYRMAAMRQIGEFLPELPESSRKRVINANIGAIGGQEAIELFGMKDVTQQGNDLSIASMENNLFLVGGEIFVDPDQNHYVHASVHIAYGNKLVDAVKRQEKDPREVTKSLQNLSPHVVIHLDYLEKDPTRKHQFEELNQAFSELLKYADQIAKYAEQLDKREAEQMAAQQQQAPPPDPVKINKIQLDTAKAQNDMRIKAIKTQHQMRLKDATTAQKMALDRAKTASKFPGIQP
jgi:hypothetical protein